MPSRVITQKAAVSVVYAGVARRGGPGALTVRDRDAAPTMIRPRRPSPADAVAQAVLPGEGTPAASTD